MISCAMFLLTWYWRVRYSAISSLGITGIASSSSRISELWISDIQTSPFISSKMNQCVLLPFVNHKLNALALCLREIELCLFMDKRKRMTHFESEKWTHFNVYIHSFTQNVSFFIIISAPSPHFDVSNITFQHQWRYFPPPSLLLPAFSFPKPCGVRRRT